MFKFVAIVILLALSSVNGFWQGCNIANTVTPYRIESPSCSGDRCQAVRGETLHADVHFIPAHVHQALNVRVTAFIFGIGVNLPIDAPHDNACNSMTRGGAHGCPTLPGVSHLWQIQIEISRLYPAFTNTRVRFEILEHGVLQGCADVTADLV